MTEIAILAIAGLLVLAYLLDHAGRRYKLPSVVLLIGSGIALRQLLDPAGVDLKWIDPLVPVLLLPAAWHLGWQAVTLDPADREGALHRFRSNRFAGLLVLLACVIAGT